MVTFLIALRSLLRRKRRMIAIGLLVVFGTVLIVFGQTFANSAAILSRQAIINYFTGDGILYSARSKEKPSPFSFTTPLVVLDNAADVAQLLDANPLVEQHVAIAQNYGLVSVEREGKQYDLPFIFYAVDPQRYRSMFPNIAMRQGNWYDSQGEGVVISTFQNEQYQKNYGVTLQSGDSLTLLSVTQGGSVNAWKSRLLGIFEPERYRNVFNYINFLDIDTYSSLYSYSGVDSDSLPDALNAAMAAETEDDIFSLGAEASFDQADFGGLVERELSGYTMIAVRLKDHGKVADFLQSIDLEKNGLQWAGWEESSAFFARVASVIEGIIYGATFLIFLIVVFILTNTLIINTLERTNEIGTLRAIGADKSFVRSILLWESLLLNTASALLGFVASALLIAAFGGGVPLGETVSQYLIGGGTLSLVVQPWPFFQAFFIVMVVSLLATLYPAKVATAITPLKAMTSK